MTENELAVKEIRKLVIDCCRQNGSGHGGSAIGMAPLAVALWKYVLIYNPKNPNWFNRDRFILSNGHAGILLYIMLHISGYKSWTMDQLRGYAGPERLNDSKTTTICHGHPEIEYDGIEISTGPLGQGIANAVGMAIAAKNLGAQYNKDGFPMISSQIYCTTGDGCIQEGVALEAIAIAGHLALDNLTLIYDNNQVTCDGPAEWITSDDINAKFRSMGWHTIDVFDGDNSVETIVDALRLAKSYKDKPTVVNIRTTIGYKTKKSGTAAAHHGTFDDEDIALLMGSASTRDTHQIDPKVLDWFRERGSYGENIEMEWQKLLKKYESLYPSEATLLYQRITGEPINYAETLRNIKLEPGSVSTRTTNGQVFKELLDHHQQIFAGGADLWASNQLGTHSAFDRDHYENRVCRFGVREHAMVSISNGMSAYNKGTFIPLTATYFMFYLYGAAGIRMGALCGLQVIHMATHDSISEGQNGPTHQPVELDSLFRAMPNFIYIRPCDGEEVIGAWEVVLNARNSSSMLSLARDGNVYPVPNTDREKVNLGGYVVVKEEVEENLITLVSSGSELQFAVEAANILKTDHRCNVRVVSMPCFKLFQEQSIEYRLQTLGHESLIISVEPYISTVWAQICSASIAMTGYGHSGSPTSNYERYGFTPTSIAERVHRYATNKTVSNSRRFWELI
ncbi:transketolase TKL1 [Sugiyamaella lignohabitans]|uniref:Transketolase TKL1 n=1 Tax=Sugiyamaella lignohabitans TaxID=796027 RepID=A0A161HJN7_9ASCO|nr:transketolase TKL1 [Sugiyamaella lignohabitans]ANB11658.1 transketolase TKL1 [Sugiyamaella lignohabitans]